MPSLTVTSNAYQDGAAIPREFTCDGADRSPPLEVKGFPAATTHWALVLDDPDAPRGTWTHWTVWDLPVTHSTLAAGADVTALGGIEGTTTAGSVGYHGPCPPSGTHRYIVHAYALPGRLGLPAGASVEAVHRALQGKVLAEGSLLGRYARS